MSDVTEVNHLVEKLNTLKEEKIVLLTQTFASPSTSKLIKKFTK